MVQRRKERERDRERQLMASRNGLRLVRTGRALLIAALLCSCAAGGARAKPANMVFMLMDDVSGEGRKEGGGARSLM